MAYLTYNDGLGHVMNFKKPNNKIYGKNGVDIKNNEMETEIRKSPKEYSWEYKKLESYLMAQKIFIKVNDSKTQE